MEVFQGRQPECILEEPLVQDQLGSGVRYVGVRADGAHRFPQDIAPQDQDNLHGPKARNLQQVVNGFRGVLDKVLDACHRCHVDAAR